MADIRIVDLPLATGPTAPASTDAVAIDGLTTRKAPLSGLADAIRPIASQAEAEAGSNSVKGMSPLTTAQAITAQGSTQFASSAQGITADSALQPAAIGSSVQAFSPNLATLAGVASGATGRDILADNTVDDVYTSLTTAVWTSGTTRTMKQRARDTYCILDAPGADPTGNNDSTAALKAMWDEGIRCELTLGDFVNEDPYIFRKNGQVTFGHGAGGGATHSSMADLYAKFIPQSRIILAGNAAKRIMTRRLARSSAASPNDAPMSAGLDIEAEYVELNDFTVWLDIDPSISSPTNYGANWDIGVFVGTRLGFKAKNLNIIGYFRRSSMYLDVSRAFNSPPQLRDYNGNALPSGVSGGDGVTLIDPIFRGGRQGLSILGGKPSPGGYFDAVTNQLYTDDGRGRFGHSDFTCLGGYIGAGDHYTRRRLADPTPVGGVLTQAGMEAEADNAPAALYVDGIAGNSSGQIWNMAFFNTRLSTSEMFRRRIDNAARLHFYECWSEGNNNDILSTTGTPVDTDDYTLNTYGALCGTSLTGRVQAFGRGVTTTLPFFPNTVNYSAFDDSGRLLAGELIGPAGTTLTLKAGGTNNIGFETSGVRRWNVFGSGNLGPGTGSTYDVGSSGSRVRDVYADTVRIGSVGARLLAGAGSPEGVVSAPVGSDYNDTTNGVKYMKKTGTGNTGWKLVTQAV